MSVSLEIAKFADFLYKNVDVTKAQWVCHMIQICFGSSLGKVQLCRVFSL